MQQQVKPSYLKVNSWLFWTDSELNDCSHMTAMGVRGVRSPLYNTSLHLDCVFNLPVCGFFSMVRGSIHLIQFCLTVPIWITCTNIVKSLNHKQSLRLVHHVRSEKVKFFVVVGNVKLKAEYLLCEFIVNMWTEGELIVLMIIVKV